MALTKITQGVIKPGENFETHNINSTGVITATAFHGDGSNLTGVSDLTYNGATKVQAISTGSTVTGSLGVAGNITATGNVNAYAFSGDGSGLSGISGFADAQGTNCGLQSAFTTPETLVLGGSGCGISTLEAPTGTGNLVFTKANNITIASTVHIKTGTTVKTDVLKLFGSSITGTPLINIVEDTTPQLGGNLYLNSYNIAGTGNINISGTVTATSFFGDGSNITGITTSQISGYGGGLGGSVGVDFQEFTTSGTWNKPSGVTWVKIEVIGGGGGGGSGRVGGNANGGNGGGGSPILTGIWAASDVPDSATITIGAGGIGGAAQTADSTDGNSGTDGGTSSFGTFFAPDIYGIGGGYGRNYASYNRYSPLGGAWPPHIRCGRVGVTQGALPGTVGLGGVGTNNYTWNRNDANDSVYEEMTTSSVTAATAIGCAGGGGGGGVISGAATYTAGQNGGYGQERESTWVSWTTAITEGRNGNDAATGSTAGGMGGTGNRTGNGGNGGNGGIGAGGGGGAGVPDTYDSGAGGNGGSGRIRVWAW